MHYNDNFRWRWKSDGNEITMLVQDYCHLRRNKRSLPYEEKFSVLDTFCNYNVSLFDDDIVVSAKYLE